jgi:prolyl oligopeptidase
MHRRILPAVLVVLLASPAARAKEGADGRPQYPATRTDDVVDILHGEKVPDPYRWLEPDDAPEVEAWDLAQNALLRARLDAFPQRQALQDRLYAEMALGGMASLPTFRGGRRWYTYRRSDANHAILYVTNEAGTDEPRVVIDPNQWSADGTSTLNDWTVSPDGAHVAYRRGEKGSEDTTLYVLRVADGSVLADEITRTKFSSVVWSDDGKGFFYKRLPAPKTVPAGEEQYHSRIRYHALGTDPDADPIVYGEGRPMLESMWVYRSNDERHVFVTRGLPYQSVDTFELEWKDGKATLHPIVVGAGDRTWVDRVGNTYVLNTDRNTGRREIFTAQRTLLGGVGTWRKKPFPAGETGVIEECWPVGGRHLLCHVKKNVVSHLYVAAFDSADIREIPLPGPGSVGGVSVKAGDERVWFTFQSYSRALTTYRCDLSSSDLAIEAIDVLPTSVELGDLVSVQTSYESKDGTEVPIFLLHHKDTKLDGSAPTVLYGYGGFRVGLYPRFSRSRAIWAERGGVYAVACLRGGAEFGEAWHQAGCLGNKQNVFDDFIAAADWLVSTGRASRAKLAIQGGSNGGLLVATCINQRPDLASAVVCGVPLTDMLRFHKFQYAKSWTKEYGDPDVAAEYAWIRPYSPYHNVQEGAAYPAMLVTAGLADSRVNAFHARKIVAAWQAATSSDKPVLLRIDRKGGHGAANVKRAYDEILDEWCFLLRELGADS